jgi:hypothetical protein
VIPDRVAQENPLLREGLKRKVVTQDDPDNLLLMPGKDSKVTSETLIHNGNHPDYDNVIRKDLKKQEDLLESKYKSLDRVPDDVLEKAIRETRERWRKNTEKKSDDIPTRINPITGMTELSSTGSQNTEPKA